MNVTIYILTFLCIAGGLGALLFAATATSRAEARREKSRKAKKKVAAPPVQMSEPEPSPTPTVVSSEPEVVETCVCNLPFAHNARFFGCDKLVEDIHATLASKNNVALVDDAQGSGGVGKTSLAAEYALRYKKEYELIWWVRASDSASISVDFLRLAAKLDLRVEDAGPDIVREAVRHTLERRSDWLLIFDDAADSKLVLSYIPRGENGHVIITSQISEWWQATVPITMRGFEPYESAEMLLGRCKSTNGAVASQLAHLMNNLPLALDLAVVHANRARKSLTDFLTVFRAQKRIIVKGVSDQLDRAEVAQVTLSITTEQAQKECSSAVDLLNLLAFFSSTAVPVSLLRKVLQDSSEFKSTLADESTFSQALDSLHQNALICVYNNDAYVHGLIRSAARASMESTKRAAYAEKALNLIANMFSFDPRDKDSFSRCSQMFPHALEVVERAEELDVKSDITSSLLDDVAVYMRAIGELKRSSDLAYKALAIAEATFGSTHPRIAVCADTLGASLHKLGDLFGARNQYERALKIDETAYGPNHPSVATRLGHMGDILREMGQSEQAKGYLERALKIAEAAYGSDHANVAARCTSLALALQGMGEYNEAKKLFERALKIDETIYGSTHPGVADRVHCLGMIYSHTGDPDKARMYFDRAKRIEESTYGHDHPRVAMRVTYLGTSLESIGDLEGARDCYEEALAIDEAVYGPTHPHLIHRMDALGRILEMMGNYQVAKDYYLQALAIEEIAHGPEDVKVAQRALKLGKAYAATGDFIKARQQLERAIDINQTVQGATSVDLIEDLVLLGEVLKELGDAKNARMQLGRALLISQEQLGVSHPSTEGIRKHLSTFAY